MNTYLSALCLLIVLISSTPALAATHSVRSAGGGDFTTVQACSNVASAGDTCLIYAGTYPGWTQSRSGSPGSPITFTNNPGDSVTVTSTVTLTNTNYITVNGFKFSLTTGRAFFAADGMVTTSDLRLTNHTITSVTANSGECFYVFGDRTLIEGNQCSGGGNDFAVLGGTNLVVRNNTFRDVDGSVTGQHIDFIQRIGGGTVPALTFSLVENNVFKNCVNDAGNCHFAIIRTGASADANTIIIRYNYAQNIDGSGVTLGGQGDSVSNGRVYNNTFAAMDKTQGNQICGSTQNAPNPAFLNNICYNVQAGGYYPFGGTSGPNTGNLTFTTGYSGSWASPYSQEQTYSNLANKDPLFANYPTTAALSANSPALSKGAALTTVASGDSGSGTTLKVNDAHFFQPGWAGTQGDWIRIGPTNTAQIASINYSTNTITLANSITRSVGEPVYLYKNSSGIAVLFGTLPDVGANPTNFGTTGSLPPAPSNLTVR